MAGDYPATIPSDYSDYYDYTGAGSDLGLVPVGCYGPMDPGGIAC